MNIREIFVWIIVVGAMAAAVYTIFTPELINPNQSKPTLSINAPQSVNFNQVFMVTVIGEELGGKTITLSDSAQTQTKECAGKKCVLSFQWILNETGSHTLRVSSENVSASKNIYTIFSKKVCLDGTEEGKCSNPPFLCENAMLVPNCSECGCPKGKVCSQNECIPPTYEFQFTQAEIKKPIYSSVPITVYFTLQNKTIYPVDDIFLAFLEIYDSQKKVIESIPQQFLFTMEPNGFQSFTIQKTIQSPNSVSFAGIRITTADPERKEIAILETLIPLTIITDTTPPLPPTNLTYQDTNGSIELNWNESVSTDVQTYTLYRDTLVTGGFTTFQELDQTPYPLYTLPYYSEAHTYVIRAKDQAGNMGEASQPIVVPASISE